MLCTSYSGVRTEALPPSSPPNIPPISGQRASAVTDSDSTASWVSTLPQSAAKDDALFLRRLLAMRLRDGIISDGSASSERCASEELATESCCFCSSWCTSRINFNSSSAIVCICNLLAMRRE
eukprot:Skav230645  [mRNA]  locus=scaffold2103:48572:48940:+ [translate_table: standard]